MNMNKSQLAEKVYEMHTKKGVDTSKKHSEEVVDFVFDTITNALGKGDEVAISGFGSFVVKHRKARMARNPKTGEMVQVAAKKVPKFKAALALKKAVD